MIQWGALAVATGISAWLTACGGEPDAEDIDDPDLHASSICLDCDDGGGGPSGGGVSSSSSSSSGGTPAPDLVAVQTLGTHCARNAWGQLAIKVKNNGTAAASASTVRVTWGNGGGTSNVATPAIGAGVTATVYANMPMACFGGTGYGNCGFSLSVDVYNNVIESNEGNNAVNSATCPAG